MAGSGAAPPSTGADVSSGAAEAAWSAIEPVPQQVLAAALSGRWSLAEMEPMLDMTRSELCRALRLALQQAGSAVGHPQPR